MVYNFQVSVFKKHNIYNLFGSGDMSVDKKLNDTFNGQQQLDHDAGASTIKPGTLFSVANEVRREISRIVEETPAVIDLIGGKEVLEETVGSIYKIDTAFEDRDEFLLHEGDDSFETASEFTRLHVEDYRKNGRPSLVTQAMDFADNIGLDTNSSEYKALILVSTRAEVIQSVNPHYHSKFHYSDVTAFTSIAMRKNNEMVEAGVPGAVKLSKEQQALGLIAAIGHDLDHEGKGNPKDDPLYNERRSFENMKPFLDAAGLDESQINGINTILTTTSPNGPHAIIKEVARSHREGNDVNWEKVDPGNKFPQLRGIESDSELVQMAAILSDADLYASGGAGIDANVEMSDLLTKETVESGVDMDFRGDKSRLGFFNFVVGVDGFASVAGRAIANDMHIAMREQTLKNIADEEKKQSATSSPNSGVVSRVKPQL